MSVLDAGIWGIAAIILIFGSFFVYVVVDQTVTACENVATSIGAPSYADDACTQTRTATAGFINTLGFVLLAMGLVAVVAAALVPVPIIFLPAGIISIVLSGVIFVKLGATMPTVFSNPTLAALAGTFPLPATIAQNIGLIVVVLGVLLLIATYSRLRGGGVSGRPEG